MDERFQHTLPGFDVQRPAHWSCKPCTGTVYKGKRLADAHWACGTACGETRKWSYRQCPDCVAAFQSLYYADHREELTAKKRQHYADNCEELKAYQARRRIEQPEVKRATDHRTRVNRNWRYANQVCESGFGCWEAAEKAMPQLCSVPGCDVTRDIQADHITPLARGGPHCGKNLQPLCAHHNQSKRTRTMEEFLARLEIYAQPSLLVQ